MLMFQLRLPSLYPSQPGLSNDPATPGSVVVRILSAPVLSYFGDVYSGKRPYPFPTPFGPGTSAIGRIASVGPDATLLAPGQLILVSPTIRGRDEPSNTILLGLHEAFPTGPGD